MALTYDQFSDVLPNQFVGRLVDHRDCDSSLDALVEQKDPVAGRIVQMINVRGNVPVDKKNTYLSNTIFNGYKGLFRDRIVSLLQH